MMKKTLFAIALVCAVSLSAQEVAGGGAVTMDVSKYRNIGIMNTDEYSRYFLNKSTKNIKDDYVLSAMLENMDEADRIAKLSGSDSIDTAEEITLLSATAGVINVRPVEAARMLPADDPALVDLQLGAMLYMKKAAVSFLGNGDPAKYAAELKFITDRGNVTNADIENFVKQGIATEVDRQFGTKYGNFIPAAVYNEAKRGDYPDALALVRNAVTNFFINPNRDTYAALTGIHARYWLNGGLNRQSFGYSGRESFYRVLEALSPAIAEHVSDDVSQNATALARVPNDPQYDVFSNPPGISGDGL